MTPGNNRLLRFDVRYTHSFLLLYMLNLSSEHELLTCNCTVLLYPVHQLMLRRV
jgi:hypothetical protein